MVDSQGHDDNFSLDDFKKWMSKKPPVRFTLESHKKGVGTEVESRVGLNRILTRMHSPGTDSLTLAKEFVEHGGKISDTDGSLFMVEVKSGSFVIPRACCRRKD